MTTWEISGLKRIATAKRPGEIWDIGGGRKLGGVHFKKDCEGPCVLHNPSGHHMSEWPLLWRYDRHIFERLCAHGIGHPDPDQYAYWARTDQEHQGVHGCDGCCSKP